MKMGLMWIVKFGMICRSWTLRVEEDSSIKVDDIWVWGNANF
jgi:hypothetical protein